MHVLTTRFSLHTPTHLHSHSQAENALTLTLTSMSTHTCYTYTHNTHTRAGAGGADIVMPHLPDAISNATRMLETLLSNAGMMCKYLLVPLL